MLSRIGEQMDANAAVRARIRVRDGGGVGDLQHHANPGPYDAGHLITFWTPSTTSLFHQHRWMGRSSPLSLGTMLVSTGLLRSITDPCPSLQIFQHLSPTIFTISESNWRTFLCTVMESLRLESTHRCPFCRQWGRYGGDILIETFKGWIPHARGYLPLLGQGKHWWCGCGQDAAKMIITLLNIHFLILKK